MSCEQSNIKSNFFTLQQRERNRDDDEKLDTNRETAYREIILRHIKSLKYVSVEVVDEVNPGPFKIDIESLSLLDPRIALEKCVVRNGKS